MKTLITLTTLVLLLGSDLSNTVKEDKSINQTYIKDKDGHVLFETDKIYTIEALEGLFNFTNLKDGLYIVELIKDFKIEIKPFAVANNNIVFIEEADEILFKPVIRQNEEQLMISLLDFSSNNVDITIYFEEEVIYKETLQNQVEYNRAFQLDKSKKGTYKAVVKANKRVYKEYFTL